MKPMSHRISEEQAVQTLSTMRRERCKSFRRLQGRRPRFGLVSLAATQLIQEGGDAPKRLFYVGFATQNVAAAAPHDPSLAYFPTDPSYLPVRVPFQKQDLLANDRAVECHKSPFSPEEMKKDHEFTEKLFGGYVWFPSWFGAIKGDDLFR